MPLIKPLLEVQIFAAFQEMQANATDPPPVAHRKLAKKLATAIDTYIKSATIIIPPGQATITAPGQVVGTPTSTVGTTLAPGPGVTTSPSPPATIA